MKITYVKPLVARVEFDLYERLMNEDDDENIGVGDYSQAPF